MGMTLGIDGVPSSDGVRLHVGSDQDEEATAFVLVLARERQCSIGEACDLVVEAGLRALGL